MCYLQAVSFFFVLCSVSSSLASVRATATNGKWSSVGATASYYDEAPAGYAAGACGYGYLLSRRLAAVSGVLFNRGSSCGRCYELRCVDHILWCRPGSPSTIVTAGDFCPPNYGLSTDSGGWCNFPLEHFQLPHPSFFSIAENTADLVPVQYRRVACERRGGVRFTMCGSWNAAYFQVLVWNVGADGEISAVKVKGSRTGWITMARNWGQNWHSAVALAGQPLSFELTTAAGGTLIAYDVAPADWSPGQTFETKNQFH